MLQFQVRIELEERFVEPNGADESNCKDLKTWVESFGLVELSLGRNLRRVEIGDKPL